MNTTIDISKIAEFKALHDFQESKERPLELTFNHDTVTRLYDLVGPDIFFAYWDRQYPDLKFYGMSVDWIKSSKYILKFKGGRGDLIIRWEKETPRGWGIVG